MQISCSQAVCLACKHLGFVYHQYQTISRILSRMALYGCDTFVVLPPLTKDGSIIFGKNSDRPNGEVQEIIYQPHRIYNHGDKVQCTYIEIEQVPSTYPVFLSKPSWMWGAEMGANNQGLVIGNEAVFTLVDDETHKERLLGMDLLRLALERASSSLEAVSVITALLETFGQGGPCSDIDSGLIYHNSFLIVDSKEAWVLETAGQLWAAEKLEVGCKNISNCLSIDTNITLKSKDLESFAKEQKLWTGGEFSFKRAFSSGGCPREAAGFNLLANLTADKCFDLERMFQILRDKHSTICRPVDDPFHTSGSWVSVISRQIPSCHWVTGTPDPSVSIFKPFIFSPNPDISTLVVSPTFEKDPAKIIPRFLTKVNRKHELYTLHEQFSTKRTTLKKCINIEKKLLQDTSELVVTLGRDSSDLSTCDKLFKQSAEAEFAIYTE